MEEALQRATRFLIAANLALLLLSGLVAAMLIQRDIAPLRKLSLAADSISIPSWTFDIPASASSSSELSSLACP